MAINPCNADPDKQPKLTNIADFLALIWRGFTYGTDCPCCLASRLLTLSLVLILLGHFL